MVAFLPGASHLVPDRSALLNGGKKHERRDFPVAELNEHVCDCACMIMTRSRYVACTLKCSWRSSSVKLILPR